MSGIVCAIRGGPLSQPTIRKAIETAKSDQIPVHFLYVVNLDFLEHSEQARTQVIQQEMREMGEFICLKAQIEARREGVQADIFIREGNVTEEIIALSRELQAGVVVLGRPQTERVSNFLDLKRLEKFVHMLEDETDAKVIFPAEDQG